MKGQAGSAMRKPPQQPKQDAKAEEQLPKHVEITAQTAIKSETLKGDVTKALLDHIQAQPKPWAKMTEYEQERCIHGCRDIAAKLVHEAVRLTASRGFDHIPVSIGAFTVDAEKGIQSKFAMARSDDNLLAMGQRLGTVVLLIPMDLQDFMGERKLAEPDVVGDLSIPKTGPGAPSDPKAEANLGRGPVDAKGNALKPDANGEVDKTKTEQMGEASQAMPGDIGPATPDQPAAGA